MSETQTNDWMSTYERPKLEGIVPYLTIDGANAAADFYIKAFGAEDMFRTPPDEKGRAMNITLKINGHTLMMSDFFPEHGYPVVPPQAFNMHMLVDDLDAWWDRAVAAGCTPLMPLTDMFWGDRYGQLKDPYGVTWALAHPIQK